MGEYLAWGPCVPSESQTYVFFWAYRLNRMALIWVIFFIWFPMKLCGGLMGGKESLLTGLSSDFLTYLLAILISS